MWRSKPSLQMAAAPQRSLHRYVDKCLGRAQRCMVIIARVAGMALQMLCCQHKAKPLPKNGGCWSHVHQVPLPLRSSRAWARSQQHVQAAPPWP